MIQRHFKSSYILKKQLHRYFGQSILGIETSCDDTGCAILDKHGQILGESIHSQSLIHLRHGGIIPDIAQDLHRNNIENVVDKSLEMANLKMSGIGAIAVTTEPGLPLSLAVGFKYARHLARIHSLPLIPIHHMQAHALVARMNYYIPFPYLTLLISGGHCLLALVNDVNDFILLGESIDCAPGELFDKISRYLKLRNLKEYSTICGGEAIELAAKKANNPEMFKFSLPLTNFKDCNFSFNGLKTAAQLHIHRQEKINQTVANQIIPEVNNLCAGILLAVTKHLIHRTQRAIEYCESKKMLGVNNGNLVVSGGVACNNFIFNALSLMCTELGYNAYRPTPKLCTDNGVMIAWNGLEKIRSNIDMNIPLKDIVTKGASPIGKNITSLVSDSNIPVKLMKLQLLDVLK